MYKAIISVDWFEKLEQFRQKFGFYFNMTVFGCEKLQMTALPGVPQDAL